MDSLYSCGGCRYSRPVPRAARVILLGALFVLSSLLLCTSQAHAAQAALSWQDPNNNTAEVGGYNLYSWLTGATTKSKVNVGKQTTYTMTGLADGQTYHFAVTAYDLNGGRESGFSNEVTKTFPPGNTAPIASNGTLTVPEDTVRNGTLSATDADGNPLTYSIVSNGSKGTATLTSPATGAYTYTPQANATGTDTFTFRANDGTANSNTATVTVTITPVNDIPVAQADTATTNEDTPVTIAVLANDTDVEGNPLTVSAVTQGAKGLITASASSVTYAPKANATGTDTFHYTVSDGSGGTATATVTVTITPVNDAPVASNGTLTTAEDTVASGTLSASDVDGDALTYSMVTQGTKGTVAMTNPATGTYTYTPKPNTTGTDTFTFKASDSRVNSNVATVTVTITAVSDGPAMELGEVRVDHTWKRVTLTKTFVDPVVVANPLSLNNTDPAVVRIRNVNATGFEVRVQEWDYLDGTHPLETVGYLVMEHGRHTLPGGVQVEAGRVVTDKTSAFGAQTFRQPFNAIPVLITSIASMNETDAATTRLRNISTLGFELRMQEQKLNSQTHAAETIAYIAWEPSTGVMDDLTYEVKKTGDVVKDTFYRIDFAARFLDMPVFVAGMQTTDGSDPADLRWQNKDLTGVEVQVDEEQSQNGTATHTTEVVGYIALARLNPTLDVDGDGLTTAEEIDLYGTDPTVADTDHDGINDGEEAEFWGGLWSQDGDGDGLVNLVDQDADNDGTMDGIEIHHGFDPAAAGSKPTLPPLEAGEARVSDTWTRVTFREPFVDPVVVAKPFSTNASAPAVVRIRNIDTAGFEMRVQEWEYLDGIHAAETVGYLVMERGTYTLPDGTRVAADRFSTSKTGSFGTVTFGQPFQVAPVVLTAVTSVNEADAVTTRVRRVTPLSFQLRMQEQELNTQAHAAETISYIAWEPSEGALDGVTFEVGATGNVITDQFATLPYATVFAVLPVFLADTQTANNLDTAGLRWQSPTLSGIDVKVEEEQSADAETTHPTEVVGYIVVR